MQNDMQYQVFIAPGEDNEKLSLPASPWVDGLWVRIPKEAWNSIVEYIQAKDPDIASSLEAISFAKDNNPQDEISIEPKQVEELAAHLLRIKSEIEDNRRFEEIIMNDADIYLLEEYQNMLSAVIAVLEISMKRSKPFRAFVD